MSGGLDSTSIAATARQLMSERGSDSQLRAQTIVYDRLIPDEERHYAGLAAEALGVPTSFFPADDYLPWRVGRTRAYRPLSRRAILSSSCACSC